MGRDYLKWFRPIVSFLMKPKTKPKHSTRRHGKYVIERQEGKKWVFVADGKTGEASMSIPLPDAVHELTRSGKGGHIEFGDTTYRVTHK